MPNLTHIRLITQNNWRQQLKDDVATHRDRKAADLARAHVTCTAVANSHQLGTWSHDPELPSRRLVSCNNCGAMAFVDVGGAMSISDLLQEPCARRPS